MGKRLFSDETLAHLGLEYLDDDDVLAHEELQDDDTLGHSGKKGMKWGVRKAVRDFDTGGPSHVKALALGIYGNKNRYSNPAALKKRVTAGHLRTVSVIASVGNVLATRAQATGNPSVAAGAKVVSSLLGVTAGATAIASQVNANQAISIQNKS